MKKLIALAAVTVTTFVVLALPSSQTGSQLVFYSFPPPPPDFKDYVVYQGTTSSNYNVAVSTTTTNYTFTGLIRGQTYFYNVTMRNTNGVEGDFTTEVNLMVPHKPPPATSLNVQNQ